MKITLLGKKATFGEQQETENLGNAKKLMKMGFVMAKI
jgi:hypothetical protein